MRVTVYMKAGCSLCDDVFELLEPQRARYGLVVEKVDIATDPALFAKYRHLVPVVCVEGQPALTLRVKPEALEQTLAAAAARPDLPTTSAPSDPAPPHRHAGALAFGALVLAWGTSYLFIKLALSGFTPLGLVATRFAVAGAVCAAVAAYRREPWPSLGAAARLGFTGVLMMSGSNALTSFAQLTVPSGITGVVHALGSVWLVLLARLPFFGTERTSRAAAFGIIGGVVGVWVLLWPQGTAAVDPLGAGALLVATWLFAVASLLQRRWSVDASPFVALALQMGCAAAFASFLALAGGGGFVREALSWTAVGAVTWLIAVSSLVGFRAFSVLLKVWPASRVGTFAVLNPVVSVVLGVCVLGESLSWRTWVGGGLVLLSVAWVQRARG